MVKDDNIFCCKPVNMNIQEVSCINYINQHSIQDYMNLLILHTVKTVCEKDKNRISDLESHCEHIHSLWFNKAFKKGSDDTVAEVLIVLLSDAIGWLRAEFKMGESPIMKQVIEQGKILDKDDRELSEEEFLFLVKTNNVHHRKCDVCGIDLYVPDRYTFSRKNLQTMVCPLCTDTEGHVVLLNYVEDLRKKHKKDMIIEILDERMEETFGKGDIFTIEDWESGCGADEKKSKIEE